MPIGLGDIDPCIARAFTDCLGSISPFRSLGPPEAEQRLKKALSKQRWLGAGWRGFVPVGAAFAAIMAGTQFQSQPLVMGCLFGLSFLFSGAGLWNTAHRDLTVGFHAALPSDVLLAALPLMDLTSEERLYTETVAQLAGMQETVEAGPARSILVRLNELLANGRQLETQRQRLADAVARHSVDALEAERTGFAARMEQTDDPATRQALQQSLEMCELRLRDARSMEQNMLRVTAQQEAVQQTLASAQSALTRMSTVPSLGSPAVEEITQAVTQINLQTVAVEQAVQEVAAMQAQG